MVELVTPNELEKLTSKSNGRLCTMDIYAKPYVGERDFLSPLAQLVHNRQQRTGVGKKAFAGCCCQDERLSNDLFRPYAVA